MLAAEPVMVKVEVAFSALNVAVPENAGEAEKTTRFVPVSSPNSPANSEEESISVLIMRLVELMIVSSSLIVSISVERITFAARYALEMLVVDTNWLELLSARGAPAVKALKVTVLDALSALKVAVPLKAGDALNTTRLVPVSSESALMRLALVRPLASSQATLLLYEKKP